MLRADAWAPDGSWADSADPRLRWALPGGLAMRSDGDGVPRFLVSRWRDPVAGAGGGLLHLELGLQPPDPELAAAVGAAGGMVRTVPLTAARCRLVLRGVGVEDVRAVADWRDVPPSADPLVLLTEALDADTAQLITAALTEGGAAVEVLVEGAATGIVGGLPVLAVLDPAAVGPRLAAALQAAGGPVGGGVTVGEIVAALLSVGDDPALVRLHPLDGAPVPDRTAVLAELAPRLLDDLFVRLDAGWSPWTTGRYALAPATAHPLPLAYDLRTDRPVTIRWSTSWSVSDWLATLAPERRAGLLPELDAVAVFGAVPVAVVCPVPVDASAGVRRVQVDVTATGPGGLPERRSFAFTGGGSVARFSAVFPAWTGPVQLSARAAATLAPVPGALPQWPRALPARAVPADGGLFMVDAGVVGVRTLAVAVDPAVFDAAARLDVLVRSGDRPVAGATLTAGHPAATLAFPTEPGPEGEATATEPGPEGEATATEPEPEGEATAAGALRLEIAGVRADDPAGTSFGLPDRPIGPGETSVAVVPTDLEDLSPAEITVTLADPAGVLAYAAVALLDRTGRSRTLTLDRSEPVRWPCHRPTVLDPVRYRWQLHHVTRRPDGSTAPLRSTDWADADTTLLSIPAPELPAADAG